MGVLGEGFKSVRGITGIGDNNREELQGYWGGGGIK